MQNNSCRNGLFKNCENIKISEDKEHRIIMLPMKLIEQKLNMVWNYISHGRYIYWKIMGIVNEMVRNVVHVKRFCGGRLSLDASLKSTRR